MGMDDETESLNGYGCLCKIKMHLTDMVLLDVLIFKIVLEKDIQYKLEMHRTVKFI